ncbi:MAG TPA: amidohydrolase family protein [Gemmatimonadales bacterium]|nr:amidohydrolase family protein [Gemmatimonadales bacterium]
MRHPVSLYRIVTPCLFSSFPVLPILAAQAPSPNVQRFIGVDAPTIALTHVRVVDGTGAEPAEDQTVVISRGRIAAVGAAGSIQVPAGAKAMDLSGHTVIPGIVGLHNHTFYTTNLRSVQSNGTAPLLYLGSGVTTIRTTGSHSPYAELNLRRLIDAQQIAGPRMHIAGPYLTGGDGTGSMHKVNTVEAVRRVVDYWAAEGVTWLKFYTDVSREVLGAAIKQAHKRGVKVTGHLCSVSFREAVSLGIDNLEHGLFVNTDFDPEKKPDFCPPDALAKLAGLDTGGDDVKTTIREMVSRRVPMTSTLAVFELFVPNRPPLEPRVLEAMAPDAKAEYLTSRTRLTEPGAFAVSPQVFRNAQQFELAFVRAGGLLAAGVDPTGNGGALPGFGDQRNYELLIEAGFTPVEAIRIMTLNGATVLGEDKRLGSITPGKLADLVVIKGDPIARPAEIRNVGLVFKDGVGYDSGKLIEACRGLVGIR